MADPSESPPPLFLDQNEARVQEKKILRERAFPLSQGLDDRPPSPYLKVWIHYKGGLKIVNTLNMSGIFIVF